MYGAPDVSRPSAGASDGNPQPIAQLAAALVELAEAQRATDQKLAQLVNISRQTIQLEETLAEQRSQPSPVIVRDINMSFGAVVVLMVKWAIAAIPAAIILALLWVFTVFFATLMLAILAR